MVFIKAELNETVPLLQKVPHGNKITKPPTNHRDHNTFSNEVENSSHVHRNSELVEGGEKTVSEQELLKEQEEADQVYHSKVYQITHNHLWTFFILFVFVVSTLSLLFMYRQSTPPIDHPINKNDDRPMSVKYDDIAQEYNVVDHHPLTFSTLDGMMSGASGLPSSTSITPTILASGKYLKNVHGNGWHYLSIKTLDIQETLAQNNTSVEQTQQSQQQQQHTLYFRSMKALGYLEGYLTCEEIILWYHNFYDGLFQGKDPSPETLEFLQSNHDWMISQANKYAYENDYWYSVKGLLEQMEGLIIGMKEACPGTDIIFTIQQQAEAEAEAQQQAAEQGGLEEDVILQGNKKGLLSRYNPWQENLYRASQDVFLPSMVKAPSLLHILLMNANGDMYQITEKFDRLNADATSLDGDNKGKVNEANHPADENNNKKNDKEPRDNIIRRNLRNHHKHHHHHEDEHVEERRRRLLLNDTISANAFVEKYTQERIWNRQAYHEATATAAVNDKDEEKVELGQALGKKNTMQSFESWMQQTLAQQKIQHIYHPNNTFPVFPATLSTTASSADDVLHDPIEGLSHRYHHHSSTSATTATTKGRRQLRHKVGPYQHNDHCSVLIKILPNNADIVIAHNTWDDYQVAYPRIMKHYSYNLVSGMTSVGMYDIHFSSSPGLLSSVDDFFILHGHGHFIVTETSIDVYNDQLFHLVIPQSMLSYMRARIANSLAHSGSQWTDIFSLYASGTYVNSWMILDLMKYHLHHHEIQDGFFHVLEESPGYIHSADMTSHLRNTSYWASYNNPYFEDISRLSGQYALCQLDPNQCYATDPRGLLFAKYQSKITTLEELKDFILYNQFDHDVESLNDSCNSISCREDLEPNVLKRYPFGAIDSKVSSIRLAQSPITTTNNNKDNNYIIPLMYAHLGPSNHKLAPFCWSNLAKDVNHTLVPGLHTIGSSVMYSDGPTSIGKTIDAITGSQFIHDGHPDCFNYTYELFPPLDLLLSPSTTTIQLPVPAIVV